MNVLSDDAEQACKLVADHRGLVDLDFLEEIHRDFGTKLLWELKANLETETQEALRDLDQCAEAGDPTACAEKCHFLRGAAINLGLAKFSDLCQRLETMSRDGAVPSAGDRAALRSILIGSMVCFEARLSTFMT